MKAISNFLTSLYRFFHKDYFTRLLITGQSLYVIIHINAYIKAIPLFPDNTLKENRELAKLVTLDILGVSDDIKNKEEKKELAQPVIPASLFSDKKIMDTID